MAGQYFVEESNGKERIFRVVSSMIAKAKLDLSLCIQRQLYRSVILIYDPYLNLDDHRSVSR